MVDRVIWPGCGMLFVSGAVWGANLKAESFFVIANLHDLFDIFGAMATVAAVVLAVIGFNRWKVEVGAASDHELARRLSVVLLKYRLELESLWGFANVASQQSDSEAWMLDHDQYSQHVYESALARIKIARSELEAVGLECSAIWGGMYEARFDELFKFENICANTVSSFLYLCAARPIENYFWESSSASVANWAEFNSGKAEADLVEGRIKDIISPIYNDIQKKLLRGIH